MKLYLFFLLLAGFSLFLCSCCLPNFNSNEFIREAGLRHEVGNINSNTEFREFEKTVYAKVSFYHYRKRPNLTTHCRTPHQLIRDESIPMQEYYVPLDQSAYGIWLASIYPPRHPENTYPKKIYINPTRIGHRTLLSIPGNEFDLKHSRRITKYEQKRIAKQSSHKIRYCSYYLNYSSILHLTNFQQEEPPLKFKSSWDYCSSFYEENSSWTQRRLADIDEIVIDTPGTIIIVTSLIVKKIVTDVFVTLPVEGYKAIFQGDDEKDSPSQSSREY